jgi:hypothetical protein
MRNTLTIIAALFAFALVVTLPWVGSTDFDDDDAGEIVHADVALPAVVVERVSPDVALPPLDVPARDTGYEITRELSRPPV